MIESFPLAKKKMNLQYGGFQESLMEAYTVSSFSFLKW